MTVQRVFNAVDKDMKLFQNSNHKTLASFRKMRIAAI